MASVGQPFNFNSTTPAAPAGSVNVIPQADAPNVDPSVTRNGSAYVTFAYDISVYFPTTQSSASQEIFRWVAGHTTNFAGNFAGSYGSTKTTATGSTTFIVNKNGSQIGTIVWAGAGTTPTFTTTSGAAGSFSAGDIMTIVGPATADTTLANWCVTLVGTRTS